MSSNASNSSGAERDLLCRGVSGFFLWCVPWVAFALGFGGQRRLRSWGQLACLTLPDAAGFTAALRGHFSSFAL
jgi:hypothetical protein